MSSKYRRFWIPMMVAVHLAATVSVTWAATNGISRGGTYEVQVTGFNGVAADVKAVALQLTVSDAEQGGFVTAFPCGTPRPETSNVNFDYGEVRSNLALVGVGTSGKVCVYSSAAAHLIVDLVGSFVQSTSWSFDSPTRAFDTRVTSAQATRSRAGSITKVPVSEAKGSAMHTGVVAVNLTSTDSTSAGYLSIFSCNSNMPGTSSLNYQRGQVKSNLALAAVHDGFICVYSSSDTHIIVDVLGRSASSDGIETGNPHRLVDTRIKLVAASLAGNSTLKIVGATSRGRSATLLNVTAIGGQQAGYLTIFDCGGVRPSTSNVNFMGPNAVSTLAIVGPSERGDACLYSSTVTDVIVDEVGVFGEESGYNSISPSRLVDTRIGHVYRETPNDPPAGSIPPAIPTPANASPAPTALTVPATTVPRTVPATAVTVPAVTVPTTVLTTSATSTPASGAMPTDATVGPPPGLALASMASNKVVPGGSYDGVRIIGQLEFGAGLPTTSFANCRIEGAIVTYSPINLTSCTVTGGIYAYDTAGRIRGSLLLGGNSAFRPGTVSMSNAYITPTPWLVADSILRIPQGVAPAHTEAAQVLGGVGLTFRNVVFDTGGPFNNTQTADLNFIGKDLLCEDCYFMGYGGYSIYSEGPNNRFVRPRFAGKHKWGIVYPSGTPPTLVEPMLTNGTPL